MNMGEQSYYWIFSNCFQVGIEDERIAMIEYYNFALWGEREVRALAVLMGTALKSKVI